MTKPIQLPTLQQVVANTDLTAGALAASIKGKVNSKAVGAAIAAAVDREAKVLCEATVLPQLTEIAAMHELMNGEIPGDDDPVAKQEWTDALDGTLDEACAGDVMERLGHGFIGEYCIDSPLPYEGGVDRMLKAFATSFVDSIHAGLTQNKFLSAIGFGSEDIEALVAELDTQAAAAAAPSVDPVQARVFVQQCSIWFVQQLGNKPEDLMSALSDCLESDDNLALSALSRFGQQSLASRDYFRAAKDGNARWLEEASQAAATGIVVQPDPLELPELLDRKKNPEKKTKGTPRKKPDAAEPIEDATELADAGVDLAAVEAIKAIKEFAKISDADVGKLIGLSRATVNNIANGKAAFSPDSEQVEKLRGILSDHVEGLRSALDTLDMVAPPSDE